MTLTDNEIVKKLKIERDYLRAKLHKIEKVLDIYGVNVEHKDNIKNAIARVVKCTFCDKSYESKRVRKTGNFCSQQCTPSYRRVQATRIKPRSITLVKGDALSK